VLEIPHLAENANTVGAGPLAIGFLASMISGVIAIRWLLVLLRRGTFYRFAPYCLVLGIVTIAWGVFVP
jgi:undecaprenyl-diphosphatase